MYNLQNNNFGRYNPSFNAYGQPYYNNMQYVQQQPQMPPIPPEQMPIQAIKFMRAEEIPGHTVNAGMSEVLVDREHKQFTIKSANMIGESYSKTYRYEALDNENEPKNDEKQPAFVKKEELEGYATKDDVKELQRIIQDLKQRLFKKPEENSKSAEHE